MLILYKLALHFHISILANDKFTATNDLVTIDNTGRNKIKTSLNP